MGITKFLYLLLVFCITIIFYDIDKIEDKSETIEKPIVSFYDSIVYNIDIKGVNNIIPSKEAYLYKNREEMVGATLVMKEEDSSYIKKTNSASAQNMVKVGDDLYLDGDVNLQMANGLHLKTEQLHYNLKTQVAQNEEQFTVTKWFHDFHGSNLYYELTNKRLKAKYTHFNIKVENE